MNNNNNNTVVSNFSGIKRVRFGLNSNISCGDIPILNHENLFDVVYGELGFYPDTIYRISLVFICSDNSLKCITESFEFDAPYLLGDGGEFSNYFNEFYNFIKEHREIIEFVTGLDCSVVDVLIYEDEDVNEFY